MNAREIVNNEAGGLDPLVSIVIPTYNRANLIGRAINSVLAQTMKYFDLIIVDDGSNDNTQQVVLSHTDERIQYLRHEHNQGQNPALNTGVRAARGQYIAFLDSDDEWLPEFLERVLSRFREDENLGAVYTRAYESLPSGRMVEGFPFHLEGSVYREALAQGYLSYMITIVVKKECLDQLGPFPFDPEFAVCQDDDFCFRIAKLCRIGLIPETFAIIHSDGGNERLIANKVAYADGWWKLINKFHVDILQECGKGVLARHYFKGAMLYLKSGQIRRAHDALILARRTSASVRYVGFEMLARLPFALLAIYLIRRLLLRLRSILVNVKGRIGLLNIFSSASF